MSLSSACLWIALLAHFALVPRLDAECITPGAWWLQSPGVDVVFTGTVTLIERTGDFTYRATITVHRVWKGKVPREVTVDVNEVSAETPRLQNNTGYLLAATRRMHSDPARQMGLGELWLPTCSYMEFDHPATQDVLRQLGVGRLPSE